MADKAPEPWEVRMDREAAHGQTEAADIRRPWWMSYGMIAVYSLVLWDIAWVIRYAVRWTEPAVGVAWGLLHAVLIFPIGWVLLIVPWLMLVYRFWLRKDRYFDRALFALAPVLAICVWQAVAALNYQPDPRSRFESLAEASLPQGVEILRFYSSGGGLVDERDMYLLKCTAAETEELFATLQLDRVLPDDKVLLRAWRARTKRLHWVNPEEWDGLEKHTSSKHVTPAFFELWTNAKHDQVLLLVTDS